MNVSPSEPPDSDEPDLDSQVFLDDLGPADYDPPPPPTPPPPVDCWRCGKTFEGSLTLCPNCRARRRDLPAGATTTAPSSHTTAQSDLPPNPEHVAGRLFWTYVALMATSILYGWYLSAREAADPGAPTDIPALIVVDVVISLLVLGAMAWLPKRPRPARTTPALRRAIWIAALPLLGLVLAANLSYVQALRSFIGVSDEDVESILGGDLPLALAVISICVQPAIFEELYFRHLLLDSFRRPMGLHAAVLVSSVMFGFAHLGQFVAVPILVLCGLMFGYARVFSGGLLLPMILHFLHNLTIVLLERGT